MVGVSVSDTKMACKKLGSKSDLFHLDGQTWLCSTGLPSDVTVEVRETSFHLHKFPLLSRSMLLEKLIQDSSGHGKDEKECVLQLHNIPGGAKAFLFVAKFCYNIKTELTAMNVVSLRCAAEYLQMSEDFGEGNLVAQTENFLNEVLSFWVDTIKALQSCEEVLPSAEELHIVSRCIESLAVKACADPSLLSRNPAGAIFWNGIDSGSKASKKLSLSEDWWYEDVSKLKLHMYKRLILAVTSKGMPADRIAGSVMFYAKKYLPLNGRQPNFKNGNCVALGSTMPVASEAEQITLLEEIVGLLPDQKGVIPTKFLLKLLKTSMILHTSLSSQEILEKRIGVQLDDAALEDILIPNMGYSVETLYDIDCVQRIVDHFMLGDQDETDSISNELVDDGQLIPSSHALTPTTLVANLVDNYLAEVAPDVNLKLTKFLSLASLIPDYSRPIDDGIYRAIDIYLKAHPWLTDSDREQLCRLMNCQKLSLEASTHAAQNERLPLRVIVQVLFFEQLRLRTSVAGWFFVSENLDNSQDLSRTIGPGIEGTAQESSGNNAMLTVDDMRNRVSALEKECLDMKQEVEKLVKTKGSWHSIFRMLGLRLKTRSCDHSKTVKTPLSAKVFRNSRKAATNGKEKQDCKIDDKSIQSEC
nr:BTB/POZ domain-containing protein At5g03250-like [Ipomoea batatas]